MATPELATVTPEGERLIALPDGVVVRDLITHIDDRGSVCELFDPRWDGVDEPAAYTYLCTVRPGVVKGWAVHERKIDHYAVLFGEAELVLWDGRPDSPTQGLVTQLFLSELRRQLVRIPPGVWHALCGLGDRDAVIVNHPSTLYDHAAPDKLGLPVDNDVIPFRFSQH